MGKKILTLLLWGLAAVFIMQTCFPSDGVGSGDSTIQKRSWFESFETPPPSEYPLILENEFVYSEWSALGASCGTVYLKNYNENLHQANATERNVRLPHPRKERQLTIPEKNPERERRTKSIDGSAHPATNPIERS